MTAATGTSRLQPTLFAAALALFLAACQPADRAAMDKRIEAKWAERQLLFVADPAIGTVRVFHLRAAPVLISELRAPGRREVRDIRVDPEHGRIWVLGGGAVYLHDARTFSLVKRIPGAGSAAERLELSDAGGLQMLDSEGKVLARIDPLTLVALRATPRLTGSRG